MMRSGCGLEIEFGRGEHACHFYRSNDERCEVLLAYVLAGLQRNEQVVCLLDDAARQNLLKCLDDLGHPVQSYLGSGQLIVLDAAASYTPDGQFVPGRMLSALPRIADEAQSCGYDAVRTLGDGSWLAESVPGAQTFGAYEAQLTRLLQDDPRFTCLCQFDQDRLPSAFVEEILLTHPLVIANSRLIRNPFHVDPDTFLSPEPSSAATSWLQNLNAHHSREHRPVSADQQRADELETVVNSIADGVATYDTAGRIIHLNAAGRRLMKYTEADLALPLCERASTLPPLRADGSEYHLDDIPIARSLRGETVSHETMCLRWRDGSHIWVRASCIPVRDAEGNVTGVVSSFHDLTALREHQALTESLLQEVEEQRARAQHQADQLDTIVSSIADAVSVCDAEGKLVRINETARRLLRYGEDADYRSRTSRCDYYRPDGSSFTFDELPLTRSLRGETVIGENIRMAWPDGTSTWVSSTSAPLLDDAGAVLGAVLTNTEITDLRQAQEQVQQEREKFLALLTMLPGYVVVLSPDHHFTYVNQRFIDLFGEPAGRECYRAFSGRDKPCDHCRTFEPLKTGKPAVWEWKAPSGRIFEIYDHPFTDLDGSPLVLEFGMDITERKRGQEEVRRHRDHLEDLVAHRTQELVEHQDRLRLVAAQLALAEEKERKRIATAIHDDLSQTLAFAKLRLGVIRRSGTPATLPEDLALLEDLLGEAIASSRRLMFELSPPILYEMGLAAAIEWLARRVEDVHSLKVEVTLSSNDLNLSQEWQITIFQAVRELLNNAAKHSKASKVRICSRRSGENHVSILVQDDGCGFDPESTRITDSSGFGLFNLRERLAHMGGGLTLASKPGDGTTITLKAPLLK